MKAAIITTYNLNVGDDFVREGIIHFLRQIDPELNVSLIYKAIPVTVRRELDWVYTSGLTNLADRLPGMTGLRVSKILDLLPMIPATDKILSSDLVVQSGAPVYWCEDPIHCADNEWFRPLIRKRYMTMKRKVPFINIAGGTCQHYLSDGSEFAQCGKCSRYIRELQDLLAVNTVRDRLSKKILAGYGIDVPLIPCTSIFAAENLGIQAQAPEYVCLNYMPGGGHYNFKRDVDDARWESIFRTFYEEIRKETRCIFVCHNAREWKAAKRIDPKAERFYSPRHGDYLKMYAKARLGIVNRVHGAFAMASFGRPSFVMGTDTRARMAEEVGLRHEFVPRVTVERLRAEYQQLKAECQTYPEVMAAIREKARRDYTDVFKTLVRPLGA